MNNKILAIGSIIACIIILLAGLSPVIGYNSARSSAKDSPLFNVRTQRATDQEQDALTCEYIGKGIIFEIPKRNEMNVLQQRIIDRISELPNEDIDRFKMLLNKLSNKINTENLYDDIGTVFPNCYTIYGEWLPGCFLIYYIFWISFFITWYWKNIITSLQECPALTFICP
jgi:hypothetical protein